MRWFVLAVWLAGCTGPAIKFTGPGAHDVQREFVLPRDMDLDTAHTAVIAVYARLMVSVEESQTKEGPRFRLINGKRVNMSVAEGLNYVDCGERQEQEDIIGLAFSPPCSGCGSHDGV